MTINYVYINYLNVIINRDDYIIKIERQYHALKVSYVSFCASLTKFDCVSNLMRSPLLRHTCGVPKSKHAQNTTETTKTMRKCLIYITHHSTSHKN